MSSGQAIGTIGGAIIGFYTGGPYGAVKGAYWGYMGGSIIDPPPGPHTEGPRLNDRVIQTSEDGAPLPVVFGTVRLAGNVIWSTGLEEISATTEQGGGSGGGGATTTNYSYKTDAAIALCAGEITGVQRIWADAKLVYDASETSDLNTLLGSEQKFAGLRIYVGSETQDPDPLIQAIEGAANAPAFRGMAYVVFDDLQLADFGNRLPSFSFEIVNEGSISTLTFHSASEEISQTIYNVGYGEDDNLYCFYSAGTIASYTGPNYGKATYYKIDIDGVKTQLFSGALYIVEAGYSNILTRPATNNAPAILYAPADLHLIVREFYGLKDAVYQGGFFVYNGNETGTSFATTPDYAVSAAGIGVGGWTGTIAFKSATEGVCSCSKYGPLVWFNGGITTTIISADVYSRGVGAIAFFDSSFLVVVNATGYATFYWYDYDFNLIDSALSTVISGKKFFTFNDEDNCLYGVQSGSSLIKIGPVDSSSTFNDSEVLTVSGTISPSRTVDISENSTPAINTRYRNVLFFSQNLTTENGFRGIVATRNLLAQSGTDLETVAETLIEQTGLDAAEYDMTALSADTVRGYTVSRPMAARAALEPLQTAYHFDTTERDGKIYAIKRGGAVVATIPEDDLGAAESPDGVKMRLTRHNESELPSEVQISYSDIDNDHQAGTQYARSLTAQTTNIQQISLPLTMTSTEAAQLAEVILNSARYTGRHTLEFSLGYGYARLAPADVVSLPGYGVQWTARIGKVDMGMPGLVQCIASPEIAALYASILSGSDPAGIGQAIGLTGTTTLKLLDCCLLRDTDTGMAWYAALSGSVDTWPGGASYKSNDSGATWTLASSATRTMSAKTGIATAALPNADCRVWDKTNRLNVRLRADATLSSATETSVLNGANAGLLGAHGRWELIQWLTATLESDGTYTLSDLLRGRKGTEHAAGSHASGDVFVVPEATTLSQIDVSSGELNAERQFKAVTNGQALEAVSAVAATYTGERMKPLAPVLFNAWQQANKDVHLSWTRRNRIARAWSSLANLAQSEASESYEIDVVIDGNVVRTLTATSSPIIYTSAQAGVDTSGVAETAIFNLYQISADIGRGHVAGQSVALAGYTITPQISTITLGGTFAVGEDWVVFIYPTLALSFIHGQHVAISGDTDLDGVAAELVDAITDDTDYDIATASVVAVGSVITVTADYAFTIRSHFNYANIQAFTQQAASGPRSATSKVWGINIGTGTWGLNNPVAGKEYTVIIKSSYNDENPVVVSAVSNSAENADGVLYPILAALQASSDVSNLGLSLTLMLNDTPGINYGKADYIKIIAAPGYSPIIIDVAYNDPAHSIYVGVISSGRSEILTDIPQISTVAMNLLAPSAGSLYSVSIGTTTFTYTTLSGDDHVDIGLALIALINADAIAVTASEIYSAADGYRFTLTGDVANTPFSISSASSFGGIITIATTQAYALS